MDPYVLEEVLACPSLPSLPAVAVQVLEQTSDPNLKLEDLARTIEADQGLATKILRTVNSSFFGLRKRCASIERALALLGLDPVKNLALGFSLVTALKLPDGVEFDEAAYWRRALYSAVGARCFAIEAKLDEPDEAFLAALLQDVGVMAMFVSLGDEYASVLASIEGDHRKLCKAELDAMDVQHPDIGAMLAQRWRLPDALTIPVRFHERPTAAPPAFARAVKCVALGNLVHDVLSDDAPAASLRRLYQKAKDWLELDTGTVDAAIAAAGEHVREVSKLFELDTGEAREADAVMERAQSQMMELSRAGQVQVPAAIDEMLSGRTETDPLTGLLSRGSMEELLQAAIATQEDTEEPVILLQIAVGGLGSLEAAGQGVTEDDASLGMALVLRKHFEPNGGVSCRVSRSLFGVVLPGKVEREARQLADLCIADAQQQPWAQGLSFTPGLAICPDAAGECAPINTLVAVAARDIQRARTSRGSAAA